MELTEDLTDPTVIDDPFEYYGHLRDDDPVHWNETWGGWIVTKYDDVKSLTRDTTHLSVEPKADWSDETGGSTGETRKYLSRWLVFRDPPEHTRLRTLAIEAFNSRAVEELRPDVENLTQSLIDDIQQEDPSEIDFISEFAYQLPIHVICELLGIPLEDKEQVKQWSDDIALRVQHFYGEEDRHERTEQSIGEFAEYLEEIVERRKANPKDDLITHLVQAESEGKMLDDDEVIATTMLLVFGGHETTTNLLANGILELLRHPDQLDALQDEPSLAPDAVEEILRYHPPIKAIERGVIEDFELRGRTIEAGQMVQLNLVSANRDPAAFEDPDSFDITRGADEHLAFGGGTHYCLGAPLARLEATVAIPAFLNAFPETELATQDIQWRKSAVARGAVELPLQL